ncbi:MAG TPA: DUF6285 domain-containing protein [Dongiaceae bacterium]
MSGTWLLASSPAELIERAIETLRGQLVPRTAGMIDRDAALAALRALGIAQAELASDPATAGREIAEIEALLGRTFEGDALAARRALAEAIRARRVPSESSMEVRLRDHLLRAAANRLRITNPKYMTRRQRRAESSY